MTVLDSLIRALFQTGSHVVVMQVGEPARLVGPHGIRPLSTRPFTRDLALELLRLIGADDELDGGGVISYRLAGAGAAEDVVLVASGSGDALRIELRREPSAAAVPPTEPRAEETDAVAAEGSDAAPAAPHEEVGVEEPVLPLRLAFEEPQEAGLAGVDESTPVEGTTLEEAESPERPALVQSEPLEPLAAREPETGDRIVFEEPVEPVPVQESDPEPSEQVAVVGSAPDTPDRIALEEPEVVREGGAEESAPPAAVEIEQGAPSAAAVEAEPVEAVAQQPPREAPATATRPRRAAAAAAIPRPRRAGAGRNTLYAACLVGLSVLVLALLVLLASTRPTRTARESGDMGLTVSSAAVGVARSLDVTAPVSGRVQYRVADGATVTATDVVAVLHDADGEDASRADLQSQAVSGGAGTPVASEESAAPLRRARSSLEAAAQARARIETELQQLRRRTDDVVDAFLDEQVPREDVDRLHAAVAAAEQRLAAARAEEAKRADVLAEIERRAPGAGSERPAGPASMGRAGAEAARPGQAARRMELRAGRDGVVQLRARSGQHVKVGEMVFSVAQPDGGS